MKFSIVTPSYRNSAWLKLCVASVADQAEVDHEHIVQDAGSDDGTQDWLASDSRVRAFVEKDNGMYDALNRGFLRATGDLLAYLNCDEQYLAGALRRVADAFTRQPETEVLLGGVLVVNSEGEYLCERQALRPQTAHTRVSRNLSFLTAGMFIRRDAWRRHQLAFDDRFRAAGDAVLALRLIEQRARMAVLPEFVSAFTETGKNLGASPAIRHEQDRICAGAPAWARALKPLVIAHFRLRRWLAGHYRCQPRDYAIYTRNSLERRVRFRVERPTAVWQRRSYSDQPGRGVSATNRRSAHA